MWEGVVKSILKLDGRTTLRLPCSASDPCPLSRSGRKNDLGVVGSEESILEKCFGEGSKILTNGLVINPKTCIVSTNINLIELQISTVFISPHRVKGNTKEMWNEVQRLKHITTAMLQLKL